jgi:hypothetical protein
LRQRQYSRASPICSIRNKKAGKSERNIGNSAWSSQEKLQGSGRNLLSPNLQSKIPNANVLALENRVDQQNADGLLISTDRSILDMVNRVADSDTNSPLAESFNSISKTYGRLSRSNPTSAGSEQNSTALESIIDSSTISLDKEAQAVSRKKFVHQFIGAAVCAAVLDFAVQSNVGPKDESMAIPKSSRQQDTKQTLVILPVDRKAAAINLFPAAAALAQILGGTFTAVLAVLQVSVPFLANAVLLPAASKLVQLSTDVILPTAAQLASSAPSVVLPAVDLDLQSAVPSTPDLPEAFRAAISQAPSVIPGAAQAGAAASVAMEAAGAALRQPVEQVLSRSARKKFRSTLDRGDIPSQPGRTVCCDAAILPTGFFTPPQLTRTPSCRARAR